MALLLMIYPLTGIILGLILGLVSNYYDEENKKDGKWQVSMKKLVYLGIPVFLVYYYMLKLHIKQQ